MARKKLNRKKLNAQIPVYTGAIHSEEIGMQLFTYNSEKYNEDLNYSNKVFSKFPIDNNQYWLNTHGIHDVDKILKLCHNLGIHALTIQDILDINQRPKFQDYEGYWFFSIKSMLPSEGTEILTEQLSFILGKNYLVSFQEKKADYFEHLRQRIRDKVGLVRERGTDYLLYLLFESILDNYFKTVNNIEAQLEVMNLSDVETDPSPSILKTIELYRRQIHQIQKTVSPIKEFVSKIEREELGLISEKHLKYFYELKDLCLSLMDECDQIDLRLAGNINLFFSLQGHRMNQVMKTLTIVATIFIPLTFVAGIYGMNFENMPELKWEWGYLTVWFIILTMLVGMLIYFRRKKWF
jgi:magnesium transporter